VALGILGGVFDPPHVGHVALARAAIQELSLDDLLVLVVADPGHKHATTPAETRLELARLAFTELPAVRIELDGHARTVDSLEERRPEDAFFIIGGDELADFEQWTEPDRVLELVQLGVALRPGVSIDELRRVKRRLSRADRVVEFPMEPVPVSSSEIRERIAQGESIHGLVPESVAAAILRLGLYRVHE